MSHACIRLLNQKSVHKSGFNQNVLKMATFKKKYYNSITEKFTSYLTTVTLTLDLMLTQYIAVSLK